MMEEGEDGYVLVSSDSETEVEPEKKRQKITSLEQVDGELLRLRLEAEFVDSPVPEKCKNNVPCCVGIDEAGRGPVLGPLVYGAAYWPISEKESIDQLGFNDSKALSASQREAFYKVIKRESSRIGSVLCFLPAEFISAEMMRRTPVSLNEMSYKAAIAMVKRIQGEGVNVAEIFVDAVGDCTRYKERLQREFPGATITVESKADATYKIVGAASIFAKVSRDSVLANWTFREKYNTDGTILARHHNFSPMNCSGYPGDAATVTWLKENANHVFGYPSVVRFSWRTTRRLFGEDLGEGTMSREEKRLKEEEMVLNNMPRFAKVKYEDLSATGFVKLGSFFAKNKTGMRNKFFKDRALHVVDKF